VKAQEPIKEIIEALNKHQNETENTMKREINKLRPKIKNIKEEVIHNMLNLIKTNETAIQNQM
jgi:molecular chaperone GrpE (heat shock protein)